MEFRRVPLVVVVVVVVVVIIIISGSSISSISSSNSSSSDFPKISLIKSFERDVSLLELSLAQGQKYGSLSENRTH